MGETWLISVDTDRIKEFVYGSRKLRHIRAASSMLTDFDGTLKTKLAVEAGLNVIYMAGGSGVFEADSKTRVDTFKSLVLKEIAKRFDDRLSVTVVSSTFSTEAIASDLGSCFRTLAQKVRERKSNRQLDPRTLLRFPFIEICRHCGEPAVKSVVEDEDEVAVCRLCETKQLHIPHLKKSDREFLEELYGSADELFLPRDFGELAQNSGTGKSLGYIYADGNQMGNILRNLKTKSDYIVFSDTVTRAMRDSVRESILQLCPKPPSNGMVPFIPLLCGGDDLILVCLPEQALQFATIVSKTFWDKTQEGLGSLSSKGAGSPRGISLSVGVVVAPASFPILNVHEMAEQLLKNAKRKSFTYWKTHRDEESGAVDFHIMNTGYSSTIKEYRSVFGFHRSPAHEGAREAEKLACIWERPYIRADLDRMIGIGQRLARIPGSRRQELLQAILTSRQEAMTAFLRTMGRIEDESQRNALSDVFEGVPSGDRGILPWRKPAGDIAGTCWTTPLTDALEITDLVAPAHTPEEAD